LGLTRKERICACSSSENYRRVTQRINGKHKVRVYAPAFGENHQRLSVTVAPAALVQMEMPLGTRMPSNLMEKYFGRSLANAGRKNSCRPITIDALVAADLWIWQKTSHYRQPEDCVFASPHMRGLRPFWPGHHFGQGHPARGDYPLPPW
jgi:hypothetical protein